jgi:hypothetical protein
MTLKNRIESVFNADINITNTSFDIDTEENNSISSVTNLVFQGGQGKGLAYVSALTELEKNGFSLHHIQRVAGTSSGSLTAALLAVGWSSTAIRNFYLDFERDLRDLYFDPSDSSSVSKNEELLHYSSLRKLIERYLYIKTGIYNLTFKRLHQLKNDNPKKFKDVFIEGVNAFSCFTTKFNYLKTPDDVISDVVCLALNFKPSAGDAEEIASPKKEEDGILDNHLVNIFDFAGFTENMSENNPDFWEPRYNPNTLAFRLHEQNQSHLIENSQPRVIDIINKEIDEFFVKKKDADIQNSGDLIHQRDDFLIESTKDNEEQIVLTAYFSGTGHEISDQSMLAGLLYANTQSEHQIKMGFSGTGVTNGLNGILFGTGLEEQCEKVKKQILDLIKQGKKVKLNSYGHSRGGIGALLLTKMLGDFPEDILEINLALFDTVPGNLLITQKIDFLELTLANQAMDLSKCHNLKRVLSLYTNEPLPDLLAHAPLFPIYPAKTLVEEDVLPGCHAGAQCQGLYSNEIHFENQSLLTFSYVSNFLKACGTQLEFSGKRFFNNSNEVQIDDVNVLKSIYESEKKKLIPSSRAGHYYRSIKIKTDPTKEYLNKQHQEIAREDEIDTNHSYALSVNPPLAPKDHNLLAYKMPDMTELFREFLTDLLKDMSTGSKSSEKGTLITRLQSEVTLEVLTDQQALKNAMRNVLALVLQRDRYTQSLFSTTTTGYAARDVLRQKKYQPLADLIQGSANHQLRYRDLRMFVLGENNESYFNAKNRDHIYEILQDSSLTKDNLGKLMTFT